jgi:hypothetical protein
MIRVATALIVASLAAGPALARSHTVHRERAESAPVGADFNGSWVIEAATTAGQCGGLVPNALTIRDNRIVDAGGVAGSPWGYIESDGTIVARFTDQGGHVARANGKLRGSTGSGAWSSPTDMCGGAWRAQRSGAERAER